MPHHNPHYQSAFAALMSTVQQEHQRICNFTQNGLTHEEEIDLLSAVGIALISARLATLPLDLRDCAMEELTTYLRANARSAGGSLGTEQILRLSEGDPR